MTIHIPDNNLTAAEMFALFGELAAAFLDPENIWVDQEGVATIPTNYGTIEITVP